MQNHCLCKTFSSLSFLSSPGPNFSVEKNFFPQQPQLNSLLHKSFLGFRKSDLENMSWRTDTYEKKWVIFD